MLAQRKVVAYRLTISGLAHGTDYGGFIRDLRQAVSNPRTIAYKIGTQTRVLEDAELADGILRLRFLSFKPGYRPDVIDTSNLQVSSSPLSAEHAFVERTHAVGGRVGNRYLLLIERSHVGISPAQIEEYLQLFIDAQRRQYDAAQIGTDPIVVSLEAVPSETFVQALDHLDRIRSATIRIVRPNPGWWDNEGLISQLAAESDAKNADLTLIARRGATLEFFKGIVAVIREKVRDHTLDGAKIEGEQDGREVKISTKQSALLRPISVDLDLSGQVDSDQALEEMGKLLKELE